ncbi:MAG: Ig-like domain-containing protein [Deferrisomatales bacterium]
MRSERRNGWFRVFVCLLLLLLAPALYGCGTQDSANPPAAVAPPADDGGGGGTVPPPPAGSTVVLDLPNPTTITAGGDGSVMTATVRTTNGLLADGVTVTFSATPIGSMGQVTPLGSGRYQATFTSTAAGNALITVRANVDGVLSDPATATVTVNPGAAERIVLTPSRSQVPPDNATTSEIGVRIEDAFGNAAPGTVDLTASFGTISPPDLVLTEGHGTASFRADTIGVARITAALRDAPLVSASIDVNVVASDEGIPALVQINANPLQIFVAEVGREESAVISVRVTDRFGSPVPDVPNNLEIELVRGPGGGENLGRHPITGAPLTQVTLSTSGGMTSVTLNSGTIPGTVQVEARVVRGADGGLLSPPLIARVPEISIFSGPPFSLVMARGAVTTKPNGTSTRPYSAVVSDIYGNAVPNGTAVFFGQIARSKRAAGDGAIDVAEPSLFRSTSSDFLAANVSRGDTLILLLDPKGGYIVDAVVNGQTLRLSSALPVSEDVTGVEFAVGDNAGGGAFDGPGLTTGGVAGASNTFSTADSGRTIWVYAETGGRTVGDAREWTAGDVVP